MNINDSFGIPWHQSPDMVSHVMEYIPSAGVFSARNVCQIWKQAGDRFRPNILKDHQAYRKTFQYIQNVLLQWQLLRDDQKEDLTPIWQRQTSLQEDFNLHLESLSQKVACYLLASIDKFPNLLWFPIGSIGNVPNPKNAEKLIKNIFSNHPSQTVKTFALLVEIGLKKALVDKDLTSFFQSLFKVGKLHEALLVADQVSDPNARESLRQLVETHPGYSPPLISVTEFQHFQQQLIEKLYSIKKKQPRISGCSTLVPNSEIDRIFKSFVATMISCAKAKMWYFVKSTSKKSLSQLTTDIIVADLSDCHPVLAIKLQTLLDLHSKCDEHDAYYYQRSNTFYKLKKYSRSILLTQEMSQKNILKQWMILELSERLIKRGSIQSALNLVKQLYKHTHCKQAGDIAISLNGLGYHFEALGLLQKMGIDQPHYCQIIVKSLISQKKFQFAFEVSYLLHKNEDREEIQSLVLKACCKEEHYDKILDFLHFERILDPTNDTILDLNRLTLILAEIRSFLPVEKDIIPFLKKIRNSKLRLVILTQLIENVHQHLIQQEHDKVFILASLIPDFPQFFLNQSMQIIILQQNHQQLCAILQNHGYMDRETHALLFDKAIIQHRWFFDCLDDVASIMARESNPEDRLSKIVIPDLQHLLKARLS